MFNRKVRELPIRAGVALLLLFAGLLLLGMLLAPSAAHGMTYAAARRLSPAKVRTIIRAEAKRAHFGRADTAALVELARRESRWHATSHSRSGCYGVLQLSYGMAHGHRWYDPSWNTRRAIRYLRHRYGSARRALSHSRRTGWY